MMTVLQDFKYYIPTHFVFGKDAEARVGAALSEDGIKKVLICRSSDAFLKTTGLLDRITGDLDAHGVAWVELDGIVPNPRLRRVYDGIALARAAEKLPRVVLENGLNPWCAPGRAMPPFAPKTFNGWWKKANK